MTPSPRSRKNSPTTPKSPVPAPPADGRPTIAFMFDDMGLNRVAVLILSAFVLIVPTVAWYLVEQAAPLRLLVLSKGPLPAVGRSLAEAFPH